MTEVHTCKAYLCNNLTTGILSTDAAAMLVAAFCKGSMHLQLLCSAAESPVVHADSAKQQPGMEQDDDVSTHAPTYHPASRESAGDSAFEVCHMLLFELAVSHADTARHP